MKNLKKVLSLCLVLVLLVGTLSITAFATGTYTIKIFATGGPTPTWTLTPNAGTSVYDAIANTLDADFDEVPDFYDPDEYHQALVRIGLYESTPGGSSDIPSRYACYNPTEVTGYSGYFFLGTGPQGYHYLYVGYDWTYSYEDGGDLWDYMDEVYPDAGSTIVVTYGLQATDWWSADPLS